MEEGLNDNKFTQTYQYSTETSTFEAILTRFLPETKAKDICPLDVPPPNLTFY